MCERIVQRTLSYSFSFATAELLRYRLIKEREKMREEYALRRRGGRRVILGSRIDLIKPISGKRSSKALATLFEWWATTPAAPYQCIRKTMIQDKRIQDKYIKRWIKEYLDCFDLQQRMCMPVCSEERIKSILLCIVLEESPSLSCFLPMQYRCNKKISSKKSTWERKKKKSKEMKRWKDTKMKR